MNAFAILKLVKSAKDVYDLVKEMPELYALMFEGADIEDFEETKEEE